MSEEFQTPTEIAEGDRWRDCCRKRGDSQVSYDYHWYNRDTESAFEDLELCRQHAAEGHPRAVKYMLNFLAYRMQT